MRIGFFCPALNRIGGGEWVTVNMINSLKAKGHDIVIYSAEKIDSNRIFQVLGRELCFNEEVHFWRYTFDPYDPKSIYENTLRSLVFKFKCDLLIDTFSNNLLPWSEATYFQGNAFVSSIPKGFKSLFFLPFKILLRNSSKSSDYRNKTAMACSQFSAKTIQEAIDHEVQVLYPPISSFFRSGEMLANLRSNTVITVSRFAKEKRLEAVSKIAKLTSDGCRFIIAGACRYWDDLLMVQRSIQECGVKDKVKLMPNVSRKELRNLMRASKVCLHTGVNEPFGVSIVEAMASGCIPVVPDSGGPREFVPKRLRFESVEHAASLIESSLISWSPQKSEEFTKASERFSEKRFSDEFLRIMKL